MEKAYTIASQRGRPMPKAPKNAPQDPHASQAGLAVTPDDVRAAAAAISGSVIVTECDQSRTLSEICGCEVWLNSRTCQFTAPSRNAARSIACWRWLGRTPARGVDRDVGRQSCAGRGLSRARLGIPATIVMPRDTPIVKVKHTEGHRRRRDPAWRDARRSARAARDGRPRTGHLHPSLSTIPQVIAGQGTVALEMLEDAPELDTLVVPIGGGGLISGMAGRSAKARIAGSR